MKKFFVVAALSTIVFSSCAVGGSSDFASLYDANVRAELDQWESFLTDAGVDISGNSVGSLAAAVTVPDMLRGEFSTDISAVTNGWSKNLAKFQNISLKYESPLLGSGSFSADEIALLTTPEQYISYKNLASTFWSADQLAALKKYEGKWFDMTETADATDPLTDYEVSQKISQKILGLSRDQYESYLTRYHVFTPTAGATSSGNVLIFPVKLDKNETLNMIAALSEDLANTPMSAESRALYTKDLEQIDISGTLGFKKNDPYYIDGDLTFTASGEVIGRMTMVRELDAFTLTLESGDETHNKVTVSAEKKDAHTYVLNIEGFASGQSVGTASGTLVTANKKIASLDLVLTSDGMTATMHYVRTDDGYNGSLSVPNLGAIAYTGTVTDGRLTGLTLDGSSPMFGKVSANLTDSGDLVNGPLHITRADGVDIFSARVGLQSKTESDNMKKFGITLDDLVINGIPYTGYHAEVFATGKKESGSADTIEIPTDTLPYSTLVNDIGITQPIEVEDILEAPIDPETGADTASGASESAE